MNLELSKEDKRRRIKFPSKNKSLAEFFGIITGDGYIGQYKLSNRIVSNIEISGNKIKDLDYMKDFVSSLIEELFNIRPNIYLRETDNTIRIIIYSKGIFIFLKNLGFPIGDKGNIIPPKWIVDNSEFLRVFVRGFFDTDGNLCFKNKYNKKYPVLSLASKSNDLLESIQKYLKLYEIPSYLGTHRANNSRYKKEVITHKLEINGKKNICLFFNF